MTAGLGMVEGGEVWKSIATSLRVAHPTLNFFSQDLYLGIGRELFYEWI